MHVDDLAAALALVATRDLPGAYNVAADGWLDAAEAAALIGRPAAPALPAEVLERWLSAPGTSVWATSPPGWCRTSCTRG